MFGQNPEVHPKVLILYLNKSMNAESPVSPKFLTQQERNVYPRYRKSYSSNFSFKRSLYNKV